MPADRRSRTSSRARRLTAPANRFDTQPPQEQSSLLNRILRTSSLQHRINHYLAGRNDLHVMRYVFNHTVFVEDALANVHVPKPSLAESLRPIYMENENLQLTMLRHMLD